MTHSAETQKIGLLLVNLGSPEAPTRKALKPYLREFLMDPDVIDIPAILRWPLVHWVIVPTRSKTSADLYRKIWTADGSPLLRVLSAKLRNVVRGHFFTLRMRRTEVRPIWS
jgi:ferrochelatase